MSLHVWPHTHCLAFGRWSTKTWAEVPSTNVHLPRRASLLPKHSARYLPSVNYVSDTSAVVFSSKVHLISIWLAGACTAFCLPHLREIVGTIKDALSSPFSATESLLCVYYFTAGLTLLLWKNMIHKVTSCFLLITNVLEKEASTRKFSQKIHEI